MVLTFKHTQRLICLWFYNYSKYYRQQMVVNLQLTVWENNVICNRLVYLVAGVLVFRPCCLHRFISLSFFIAILLFWITTYIIRKNEICLDFDIWIEEIRPKCRTSISHYWCSLVQAMTTTWTMICVCKTDTQMMSLVHFIMPWEA